MKRSANNSSTSADIANSAGGDDTAPGKCEHRPVRLFYTVAIGASAGGLEALESFFQETPVDSGMAYVVIQHLSPDFKSHMDGLLARKTTIPIQYAVDGAQIEPDNIYLIPPRKLMTISGGCLRLVERSASNVQSHSIDLFFNSLAEDWGKRSVGIVLSGTGSDGTKGVMSINQAGGLILCQDDASAGFDGMPDSAQRTGVVDVTLPPQQMANYLINHTRQTPEEQRLLREQHRVQISDSERIFSVLLALSGIDFSVYKQSTVERRIARRMMLLNLDDLSAYRVYLENNPGEAELLFQDMLIGVTHFFRNPAAFDVVANQVIPGLLDKASETGSLRIWVCACATGEEVYSLAILIDEQRRQRNLDISLKIFATDVHQDSLAQAAQGTYSQESLQNVSAERLSRYFKSIDNKSYTIRPEVRSCIVFAPHNVLKDAPFTHLDMVSCRNLLIYFQPEGQQSALRSLHFSLRNQGIMMLGPSESAAVVEEEFEVLDSRWRLYRKRRDMKMPLYMRSAAGSENSGSQPSFPRVARAKHDENPAHAAELLRIFMPPSVMLDSAFRLLHTYGGAERFLQFKSGPNTSNVLDIVSDSLKYPLSAALQQSIHDKADVHYGVVRVLQQERMEPVSLKVRYLKENAGNAFQLLVSLEVVGEACIPTTAPEITIDDQTASRMRSLEADLSYTRENLQATIEELESSNEELQAANEEMLSSNEELQSTNEEMQSVNEELYTVNSEYQKKIEELRRSNDDMDNLLALTQVGVLFIDQDLRIRRYTPEMAKLFQLVPHDIGRSIEAFSHTLDYDALNADIRRAVETCESTQRSVQDYDGAAYLLRVAPYQRNMGISGAVLMLVDTSAMQQAQREIAKFKQLVDQAASGQTLLNEHGEFLYANEAYCVLTGYSLPELLEMRVESVTPALDSTSYHELFQGLQRTTPPPAFDSEVHTQSGDWLPVEVRANAVNINGDALLYASFQDITERRESQARLVLYQSAIEASDSGISIADLSQPDQPLVYVNDAFCAMTGYAPTEVIGRNCRFLQGEETDSDHVKSLRESIESEAHTQVTLLNYRKDGTPFWNNLIISPVTSESGDVQHYVAVASDVTERVNDSLLVAEQEAQVRTVLNSTAEGIVGLDRQGHCTFLNNSARRLLALAKDADFVGINVDDLINTHDNSGIPNSLNTLLKPVFEGGESRELESLRITSKDGRQFAGVFQAQSVVEHNRVMGAVISFNDTTDDVLRKQELLAAKEAADSANRAKSEFIANMSHEIRTPLAAIMGYADLMGLSVERDENRQSCAAIKQNTFHLLDIVNDILDLSKIESDKLELELSPVSVPKFVSSLYAMNRVRADEKSIALSIECGTPIPEIIQTDLIRLRQVLINLIGNAIKFTSTGGVKLLLSFQSNELSIAVQDSGVGIEPEQIDELFQPFKQGGHSDTHLFGGTGLGLSISKRLVDLLEGRIHVQSQRGEGSIFTVSVPVGELEDVTMVTSIDLQEPTLLLSKDSVANALRGHVLVAEDQPDVLAAVQKLLRKAGAQVSAAYDGRMALEMVQQHPDQFDLLLLDIQMPFVSGMEVARQLRASGFAKPIIALTAQAMKGDEERYLANGFSAFLPKPLDATKLIKEIATAMKPANSDNAFEILIVEDHEDSLRALQRLLQRRGHTVRGVSSGASALQAFDEQVPQICFLDMRLGDMHGLELLQSLKADQGSENVVFIALTGESNTDDKARYLEAGIHRTLLKPVAIDQLEQVLRDVQPAESSASDAQ